MKTLVWFRRDLRLQDNTALARALMSGLPTEAVYIDSQEPNGTSALGAATRWYLHHSLTKLQRDLAVIGVPLRLLVGNPKTMLPAL